MCAIAHALSQPFKYVLTCAQSNESKLGPVAPVANSLEGTPQNCSDNPTVVYFFCIEYSLSSQAYNSSQGLKVHQKSCKKRDQKEQRRNHADIDIEEIPETQEELDRPSDTECKMTQEKSLPCFKGKLGCKVGEM